MKKHHTLSIGSIGLLACCIVAACSNDKENKLVPTALVTAQHPMVNGSRDTSSAHKAVVGIFENTTIGKCQKNALFCTGTLIHKNWVLTAAHCVTERKNGVVKDGNCNDYLSIGIGNSDSGLNSLFRKSYAVKKVYYHPNYGTHQLSGTFWHPENAYYGTIDADIALLELSTAVPESIAKPILPHPKWLPIATKDLSKDMEFSGFGVDEDGDTGTKLKFTSAVTAYCGSFNSGDSTEGCKNGSMVLNGCNPNDYYASKGYCYDDETEYILIPYGGLYYSQTKGGPCQGDSGGPGFFKIGDVEYVSGVTSYGDIICGGFGISTAVEDYYDWIIQTAPAVASQYKEICGNGVDDDGNGKTDCEDSVCASDCDTEICGNNIDDDGNGKTDCDDPACESSCIKEICDNNIDDDNNGAIDCKDIACITELNCQVENCTNNIDDNGNGLIDCDDSQCKRALICQPERCDDGIDNNFNGLVDCDDLQCGDNIVCQHENCDDSIDNNGNGLIDCKDPDCSTIIICQPEICDDNIDNNDNGLLDCNDAQCANASICQPEICDDNIDNNGDGLVDCQDPTCEQIAICVHSDDIVEICDDQIDNNQDGLVDCDDPHCKNLLVCKPAVENCHDEIDNDGNGLVDCDDAVCANKLECQPEICDDSMDNNGNGLIDCKDEACINEDICNIAPVMQEICDDGLDNDGDDRIDCDDPDCDTSGSCFFSNLPSNGSHSSDSAEGYGNGAGSDSSDGYPQYGDGNNDPYSARHQIALIDCSASPVRSTPAPLAVLFGMLGIGALMRRRRHSH